MESAAALMNEALDPAPYAVGVRAAVEGDDEGGWLLEAYLADKNAAFAVERSMGAMTQAWATLSAPTLEDIPEQDWVATSLEGLGVVEAGRFVLYGVHDADNVAPSSGQIPIRIDANQAFGTGHHPTTKGCLELLDRFQGLAPQSILDLGCGSGVLTIAAAKLWGRRALGVDVDPTSVTIARENARLNGVQDAVAIVEGDGFENDTVRAAAPFDFVFANILAGPLVGLAKDMAARVRPFGRIMLAGMMADQEEGVRDAYERLGFRTINRLADDAWPILLLVREER